MRFNEGFLACAAMGVLVGESLEVVEALEAAFRRELRLGGGGISTHSKAARPGRGRGFVDGALCGR